MSEAIGEMLPLAVAISISPLPIIAMLVLLMSPRARTSTPAFMPGWMAAIVTALMVFSAVSGRFSQGGGTRSWTIIVKIALGTIFVYLGYREWRARPKPGQPAQLPHWLDTVEHMRPLAAAGAGFVLYVANPKNLAVGLSAAVAFASGHLSTGSASIVAAIYLLVSASTIVIPALGYFILQKKIRPVAR